MSVERSTGALGRGPRWRNWPREGAGSVTSGLAWASGRGVAVAMALGTTCVGLVSMTAVGIGRLSMVEHGPGDERGNPLFP